MLRGYPFYLLLVILIHLGCSGRESGSSQQATSAVNSDSTHSAVYNINFEKSRTFGSTDKYLIGVRGWANAIVDEKNRVFIPDYRTNAIFVFDASGRYITKMGGEGKGPGMYLHLSAFQITSDYLYIYGRTLFKITAYSLKDLTYSHTILLNKNDWKDVENLKNRYAGYREFFVNDEEIFLMGFPYLVEFKPETSGTQVLNKNNTIQWYWLNREGDITSDLIFEQKGKRKIVIDGWGSKAMTTFDFWGEPLYAMTKEGVIAAAWSTQFKITMYNSNGSRHNVIQYSFKKTPLNRETLVEDYKNTFKHEGPRLKAYETMDLPETWPALDEIFFDDKNRLWVAAIGPDLNVYKWFIFNLEGQLLARFTWPRDKPIQEVKNDYMYTSEGEKGVRTIVRYSIIRDEIKG